MLLEKSVYNSRTECFISLEVGRCERVALTIREGNNQFEGTSYFKSLLADFTIHSPKMTIHPSK